VAARRRRPAAGRHGHPRRLRRRRADGGGVRRVDDLRRAAGVRSGRPVDEQPEHRRRHEQPRRHCRQVFLGRRQRLHALRKRHPRRRAGAAPTDRTRVPLGLDRNADGPVDAAPRVLTAPEDIEKLAAQLARAKRPVVLTEGAGQEVETWEALLALCEKFALPVVEKPGALFANFPKDHALYQGTEIKPFWNDMDLAIVVRARAPWYPPSNRPPKAVIAMIDEAPHNSAMVYQSHQADMYLEGNVAQTLRDLATAASVDKAAVEARRQEL